MANYPYRVAEAVTLPGANSIEGPFPTPVFNNYRDRDKLITRVMFEADTTNLSLVYSYVVWTVRNQTTQQAITVALSPVMVITVSPSLNPGGYSFAEYAPPYPFLIKANDLLYVTVYASDVGAGVPVHATVTSEFTYVNQDGTPPNRLYQG